jgi:glycosyltransferase involved in cell wall biosynthesis
VINVLHLATGFGRGGAELNLSRLVCNMDRSRFSNTVVSMSRDYDAVLSEQLKRAGVGFWSIGMRPGVPNPAGLVRLLRIVRQVRPQILQTWMYHADLLGLLVGKMARVPVILWYLQCSLMDMANYRQMSRLVLRALVPLSGIPDAVLVNSQSGLRVHSDLGYRPKRWLWIPNSLDLDQFRPDPAACNRLRRELQIAPNAFVIGLVGRFDPMKDHGNFVRAAELLTANDSGLNFVLVGKALEANNEQIMSPIRSAGLENRFHLMGLRDDVSRITAGFDIACSSSAYGEGTSNTVAEAMACGVPCVVTDVGDSAPLVGDTGKIVQPKDPSAFAQACRELIGLPKDQRIELGMRARKRVEENFSLSSVVARYEELYEGFSAKLVQLDATQPV